MLEVIRDQEEMILQHESVAELPAFPVLKEMVDWFNAIRAARFHYLQVAFPGAPNSDVSACTRTHAHTKRAVATIEDTDITLFVYFLGIWEFQQTVEAVTLYSRKKIEAFNRLIQYI